MGARQSEIIDGLTIEHGNNTDISLWEVNIEEEKSSLNCLGCFVAVGLRFQSCSFY